MSKATPYSFVGGHQLEERFSGRCDSTPVPGPLRRRGGGGAVRGLRSLTLPLLPKLLAARVSLLGGRSLALSLQPKLPLPRVSLPGEGGGGAVLGDAKEPQQGVNVVVVPAWCHMLAGIVGV